MEFLGASGYKIEGNPQGQEGMRDLYATTPALGHFVHTLSRVFKVIIQSDCLGHGDLQKKHPDGIVNVMHLMTRQLWTMVDGGCTC